MRVISHTAIVEATRRHPDGAAVSTVSSSASSFSSRLIERFEAGRYPIHLATPRQRLARLMDDRSLTQADVWRLFGTRARASETLNGKRGIGKIQAKKLAPQVRVPV